MRFLRPVQSRQLARFFTAWFGAVTIAAVLLAPAHGDEGSTRAQEALPRFLEQHCVKCHSGDDAEKDLRLDELTRDFQTRKARDSWSLVVEQLEAGEMPPKKKPRPATADLQAALTSIKSRLIETEKGRRTREGRVVLRRLNRAEYENTVHDLLGIDTPLKDLLPEDGAANGFDNASDALQVSSFLLERYLEAADKALSHAIVNGPQPPTVKKRNTIPETHRFKSSTERVYRRVEGDTVVLFSSSHWNAVQLSELWPQHRGLYRFRISAYAVQSGGKPVTFQVTNGDGGMGGAKAHLVGYFDALPDKPQVFEFVDLTEAKTGGYILPYGTATAHVVNKIGAESYDGPGVAIEWLEAEGPLHEMWPPASHRQIFGDLPQKPASTRDDSKRIEVTSDEPLKDAERILRKFARRAFRRPVSDADLAPFLALARRKHEEGQSFEQATRVGLAAIMTSPDFLFLQERPGKLDDFALASRLSYFLWSSMPDDTLLATAERGELREPAGLRAQVERSLAHPKSAALTKNFVGQWLGLREIDFTEPSHTLYPEFDEMLKISMVRETELFFEEVLKHDLSITNFLASDFTMLNGRLAKHYAIPGVDGFAFKKVNLPPDSHRGGVLTMASVLKVTANGTTTSPVMRGVWLLDKILGAPPRRPPADVGTIEPDTRGSSTIREQLDKHRQLESCAVCHVKIDPPGFALESYDVIGGWRDYYRATGNGKPVIIDGTTMRYLHGPKVDSSCVMPDGRPFANIDEFKRLLLEQKDQFARALASKLIAYATGAAPDITDQPAIAAMAGAIKSKHDGFRSLVHEVVQSKMFREK